jgi:soluble lytic murein transglycosylase-like protein
MTDRLIERRRPTCTSLAPVLCLALFTAGCATDGNAYQMQAAKPHEIRQVVVQEAVRMRVPVSLALAVAHAVSSFDAGAESTKGARGVMQVMPATAKYEYGIDPDLLWNPRINIRIGLHFLRRLLNRYRGRIDLALSYYNGGSAVGVLPRARVIPATARYVARVRRLQAHYRNRLRRGEV